MIARRMIEWVDVDMQPTQWATERVDEPLGLCRPLRGLARERAGVPRAARTCPGLHATAN